MPDDPALRFFPDEYLPNAQTATVTFAKWRQQQPAEHTKWIAFRDAVLRGEQAVPPALSTKKGKELVAAAKLHMGISRLAGAVVDPYPTPTPAPAPPPPPPPPPSGEVPWSGYRYSIAPSLDQATDPNRPEIVYQADGSVTLTCFPNTTFFETPPTRQLVSVYTFNASAAAGRRVRYETRMTFPANFRGTTGEINWWFEWHTTQGDGASQLSCTIGGRCDYPLNQDIPGENLTWFFRPIGPGGTPPFNEMVGPAIPQGVQNVYDVRVEILWHTTNGVFAVWLNGVQVRNWNMPTLWTGDIPALGVYNYRLKVPFTSSLNYTKPVVTILSG